MFSMEKYANSYIDEFTSLCLENLKRTNSTLFKKLEDEDINNLKKEVKRAVFYLMNAFNITASDDSIEKMTEDYNDLLQNKTRKNSGVYNILFDDSILSLGVDKAEFYSILQKPGILVKYQVDVDKLANTKTLYGDWSARINNSDVNYYSIISNDKVLGYSQETMSLVDKTKKSPVEVADPDNTYQLKTNDRVYEFLKYIDNLHASKKQSRGK